MIKPFSIEPSPHRAGFYRCLFNGQPPQLMSALRSTIGAVCVSGIWVVPFDRMAYITQAAKECGYDIESDYNFFIKPGILHDLNKHLYLYQQKAVARGLQQRRLMLAMKPGLGKTATALCTMMKAGVSRALIVCPAIVRDTWTLQFSLWWPQAAHEVQIIETGKEAAAATAPIVVVSYELMAKVKPQEWGAVILDEIHYLKDANSKRSKEAFAILKAAPKDAIRLGLTGTPIANEPVDLHNQVELLYPDLWGNIHEFKRRYCLQRDEPHAYSGKVYYGVNPRFAAELKSRLEYVSVTATEEEIIGLLPPVMFETIRVRPEKSFNLREYLDNFNRRDLHNSQGANGAIRACGQVKIDKAVELVRNDLAGGSTHVSVMTHLRETAYEIGNALIGEGVPVGIVTGADEHKARHAEIAKLAAYPKAIFVGTMHCVNVGINELKDFPNVIYAELDYRPDEVVQSMKRYHRIGGKANVRIRVLVLEGTLEERVAKSVGRKLRDQKMISDVGTLAGDLEGALDHKMSDEEFYARCQEAAAKSVERDIYA